ncbi:hypothetical protein N7U66_00500 [Lacinutrix neustonica]|uniref:Uncharacterized protein n=1 Tax=Lacinutrix neustonica TaxID=2980107 RepID=A0A9E8MVT9_9FLAO|nr:hypothetical protein [Lacinutrix neustonica]WAC02291.1 hypothetical protein N7U66_00500 [Lacinutrix neustonica]
MRTFFSVLVAAFVLISCDDGDVLTVELDFDDTYQACGDLVLFKTKTSPNESLSLQLESVDLETFFETEPIEAGSLLVDLVNLNQSYTINGSTNRFNYRTYSSEPVNVFCNDVPSANLDVINDYSSNSGNALFTINLVEDDNDGIPAALEDENLDGDNDPSTMPTDTDGDGLPNYLDQDDDGDNVFTSAEKPNYSVELGLTAAQDTDGDGTPDYLDTDDDGDGVFTRDEESNSANSNPTDDITNSAVGPDFLNPRNSSERSSYSLSHTFH